MTRLAREGENKWTIEMFDDLDELIHLESLDCDIPLQRMYLKVEFEQEENPPGA